MSEREALVRAFRRCPLHVRRRGLENCLAIEAMRRCLEVMANKIKREGCDE